MFVSVALRVKPAAPDVNDAFRVAPAVKQPGQVPDGRVQGVERRIAFEYQNVEQAVVPLGEIGERQCAGRASVEDEEDDGIASEVASVGGDGELHLTETRQVAYPVDVVGYFAEVVFPCGRRFLGYVGEETATEDIREVAAVCPSEVHGVNASCEYRPACLFDVGRHAE